MTNDFQTGSGWRNDIPDFAVLVRNAMRALRRGLPLLVLGGALAGTLAGGLAMSRPPYYTASSAIMVDPRLGSGDDAPAPTIYLADALIVDSEIEVLRSDRLLRRVVVRLQDQFDALFTAGEPDPEAEPMTPQQLLEAQVSWLRSGLSVERQGSTFVIVIGFTSLDPALAADVANGVAQEYVLSQQEDTRLRVEQATVWLTTEINRLSAETRQAEQSVQKFLIENDVPATGETGIVGATMRDVESEIVTQQRALRSASLYLTQIETDIQRLGGEGNVGDLLSMTAGTATLSRLMAQYKEAQRTAGGADTVSARLVAQILDELESMKEASLAAMQVTQENLTGLEARHAQLQTQVSQIVAKQIELGTLQREADAVEQQQRRVMDRLQRSQSQDLYIVSDTRVIDDAVPPTRPANPPMLRAVIAGVVGGVMLAMAYIFVRSQTDDRIRSSADLRQRLGLTYLGPVPRRRLGRDGLAGIGAVPAPRDRAGAMLFDSLRQAAVVLRRDRGVTLVTSVNDLPSRSMLSASIAAFLARHGEKVLLVDGDPMNRRLGALIGGSVRDAAPMGEMLQIGTAGDGLTVALAQGRAAIDPSSYSAAVTELLAARHNENEIVIIDGPSFATAVEEIVTEARVDKVLLALPFGRVPLSALEQVLDQHSVVAQRLAGVFLTDVTPRRLRRFEPSIGNRGF